MAGWHHWLDERESEWIPGVGDGQGGLTCCDSWGHKESDTTEWLIWSDLMKAKVKVKSLSCVQLFATPWTVAYQASPSMGFSVHGILQARILEWVTISFSRGSSQPRDQTRVSRIGGRHFYLWATREAQSLLFIDVNIITGKKEFRFLSPTPFNSRRWMPISLICIIDLRKYFFNLVICPILK